MSEAPGVGDYEESIPLRSGQVVVARSDLLHCVQVAVWRAGLLDAGVLDRIKDVLGLGEDDGIPKPGPRPPRPPTPGIQNFKLPEPVTGPCTLLVEFSADGVRSVRTVGP